MQSVLATVVWAFGIGDGGFAVWWDLHFASLLMHLFLQCAAVLALQVLY